MRRGVREVAEREAAAGDISTQDGSVQNTSIAVPISNSSLIEAICTDGTELKPGFAFPGSSFRPEWLEKHPDIVYELIYFFPFLF
jgi:hypothetical protein